MSIPGRTRASCYFRVSAATQRSDECHSAAAAPAAAIMMPAPACPALHEPESQAWHSVCAGQGVCMYLISDDAQMFALLAANFQGATLCLL